MTKGEIREVIELVNQYIATYMAKYTPGETALMNFEEECMNGYTGAQPVTQGTIRKLVHAVAAAVGDKTKPTTVTYPDGSEMFSANKSGVIFFDTTGEAVFRLDSNGMTVLKELSVDGNMILSSLAGNAVTSVVEQMLASEEETKNDIEEIWA